ncbi:MAG: AAA family ATPase [Pseudomonadales bacterium]|nr:AAA family ATPase [Pseudomonadales bacterium]
MNASLLTLRVSSVRSRGEDGGVIFSGVPVDLAGNVLDEYWAVKASSKLVPDSSHIQKGQLWQVSGKVSNYEYIRDGKSNVERQLNATLMTFCRPAGENLINYLATNPKFTGVGRVKAQKLWASFGESLFDLIKNNETQRLSQVISQAAAETLCNEFQQLDVSAALLFLDRIGVSRCVGSKIIQFYGKESVSKIQENPYRLIAFQSKWALIDQFATGPLGIELDNPKRLISAVEEALYSFFDKKDTAVQRDILKGKLRSLLKQDDLVNKALSLAEGEGDYYKSQDGSVFYPASSYLMERYVVERLNTFLVGASVQGSLLEGDFIGDALAAFERNEGITLNQEQRQAVITCCSNSFSMILGGAGTGKTTVLKAVFAVLQSIHGCVIEQVALAGRAAKRMTESTGLPASTIAAFLRRSDSDFTDNTAVVIDEASMVDLTLMYRLLRKLPDGCRVIMVGDQYQLPPIGPGLIFHLLVRHEFIPKTELLVVRRQEASSGIPAVSMSIRNHLIPDFFPYNGLGGGVSFIQVNDQSINDKVIEVYEELGGNGEDFDHVQIISATRKDVGGVNTLNMLMHERYRDDDEFLTYTHEEFGQVRFQLDTQSSISFRKNDLVIQTKNDYEKDVMNGTLGKITHLSNQEGSSVATVNFEGKTVSLTESDLDGLDLAYAITVHKAQGSQFKRVVVPVRRSFNLDQTMLYTAITRGVEQVVLIGDFHAASKAISSLSHAFRRNTGLEVFLSVIEK